MIIYYFSGFFNNFNFSIGLLNQKGGIYATVITLIDLKLPNFAETIIDRVLENLQKGLDSGIFYFHFFFHHSK